MVSIPNCDESFLGIVVPVASETQSVRVESVQAFLVRLAAADSLPQQPFCTPIPISRSPLFFPSVPLSQLRSTRSRRSVHSLTAEVSSGINGDVQWDQIVIGSSSHEAGTRPPLRTKQKFSARKQEEAAKQPTALERQPQSACTSLHDAFEMVGLRAKPFTGPCPALLSQL